MMSLDMNFHFRKEIKVSLDIGEFVSLDIIVLASGSKPFYVRVLLKQQKENSRTHEMTQSILYHYYKLLAYPFRFFTYPGLRTAS